MVNWGEISPYFGGKPPGLLHLLSDRLETPTDRWFLPQDNRTTPQNTPRPRVSRRPVLDKTAKAFTERFYRALFVGKCLGLILSSDFLTPQLLRAFCQGWNFLPMASYPPRSLTVRPWKVTGTQKESRSK